MEHVDHILIVDDDREIRELVGNYLKKETVNRQVLRKRTNRCGAAVAIKVCGADYSCCRSWMNSTADKAL